MKKNIAYIRSAKWIVGNISLNSRKFYTLKKSIGFLNR